MNATTRTGLRLLIAAPLAASAIALGGGMSMAHADDDNGFKLQAVPGVVDPKPAGPTDIAIPEPKDEPGPKGPGDIKNPEPGDDPGPKGPGDIKDAEPGDEPDGPNGPDDFKDAEPGDKPGDKAPGNNGGNKGGKDETPKGKDAKDKAPRPSDEVDAQADAADDVQVPNRIDAGAGTADTEGLNLAWILAGGGLVTAAGSVLARQRLARRTR